MNPAGKGILLPVTVVFILLNGLLLGFRVFLAKAGFDMIFLSIANGFLFALSLAGGLLQWRGLRSKNTNVFIRGVYSAILLKMFLCIIAVTAYAFIKGAGINKPALFLSMGLYMIYTSVEVAALMKMAKGNHNA